MNVSLPGWAVDRLRELGDGFPSRGILRVLYWYDDHGGGTRPAGAARKLLDSARRGKS